MEETFYNEWGVSLEVKRGLDMLEKKERHLHFLPWFLSIDSDAHDWYS